MEIHKSDTKTEAIDWLLRWTTQLSTALRIPCKIYWKKKRVVISSKAANLINYFKQPSFFCWIYQMTQMREEGEKYLKKCLNQDERPSTRCLSSPHHSQATNRLWLQSGSVFFEVALLWVGLAKHLTRHLSHLPVWQTPSASICIVSTQQDKGWDKNCRLRNSRFYLFLSLYTNSHHDWHSVTSVKARRVVHPPVCSAGWKKILQFFPSDKMSSTQLDQKHQDCLLNCTYRMLASCQQDFDWTTFEVSGLNVRFFTVAKELV